MDDLDNKKDNLFFIIATIILTITVTGLVLFIFYEKGFILNKEPEESSRNRTRRCYSKSCLKWKNWYYY